MERTVLSVLAEKRRSCRICVDRDTGFITNGSDFAFDPPVFSYWSQWLGHSEPKLLIVGQDFGDVSYFNRHKGQDEPDNTTNNNLRLLLAEAGLLIGRPPAKDERSPIFLTNSILCLKSGSMNAPLKERWVQSCSKNHLIPLINFLKPQVVVGMGKHGWQAVRTALNLSQAPNLISHAAGKNWTVSSTRIFAVGHCSGLGLVNRPWSQQLSDWRALRTALEHTKSDL